MARKMGKADRMSVCESTLSDEGLEDAKEAVQDVLQHLETFEEQRTAAIDAFTEAQGYHDEREWDERNNALDEAQTALEEMTSALDEIEAQSEWVALPDGRLTTLRKMVADTEEHLGFLQ
jgi:hypothetical protein